MKRGRKAQSVMEFLLTYGWAILVVLIVLSALFYLGVFETETPVVCFIEAPFICRDIIVEDDHVSFYLNSKAIEFGTVQDILINGKSCGDYPNAQLSIVDDLDLTFDSDTPIEVRCDVPTGTFDENSRVEILLEYTSQGGLTHTISGSGGSGGGGGGSQCDDGESGNCSNQKGVCLGSTRVCASGQWPACNYSTMLGYEDPEATCDDGLDNDCDGSTDMSDPDCVAAPYCGDGNIDPGEECDGSNLGGNNCTTIGQGFIGGILACNAPGIPNECTFNTTNCISGGDSYYVDKDSIGGTCNNGNPGTINQPWCTIQYAVSLSSPIQAGDTINVRQGIYKESVSLEKSGISTQKITLKKYSNEDVIIDGSVQLIGFTLLSGNTYYVNSPVGLPKGVFVDNNVIEEVWPYPSLIGSLDSYLLNNQWTYNSSNGRIYIKIDNPSNHEILVPQKNTGIYINDKKFWIIDGLKIKRFIDYGIRTAGTSSCEQDYLIIKNNIIEYIDYSGIFIGWCPGVIIDNNIIQKNGIRRENGYYRYMGVKTGENWRIYSGNVYYAPKGTDCDYLSYGFCNGGAELLYYDGNLLTYNYSAEGNIDPSNIPVGQWTMGNRGDYNSSIFIHAPGSVNPNGHKIKRGVFREDDRGHGITLNTQQGKNGRFVIKDNDVLNNNGKGVSICYSTDYCTDYVVGSVIYNNNIINSFESGFDNQYGNGVTFSNNNLWQNGVRDLEDTDDSGGDKGFQINSGRTGWKVHHNIVQSSGNVEFAMGAGDTRIYHNTIVKDKEPIDIPNCNNYGGYNSFVRPAATTDMKIKDNIYVVNGQGNHNGKCLTSSSLYGIISSDPNGGDYSANIDWNGNDYYTINADSRKTIRVGSNDYCLNSTQTGNNCASYNIQNSFPNEHRTDNVFDSFAVNPLFVNQNNNNLQLQTSSPLIDQGVPLTRASGSGSSNIVNILDAKYFHDIDNYNNLPVNEKVKINNQLCTINAVDYTANIITCNEVISYSNNDKVYWNYNGNKPDIGAFEQ